MESQLQSTHSSSEVSEHLKDVSTLDEINYFLSLEIVSSG